MKCILIMKTGFAILRYEESPHCVVGSKLFVRRCFVPQHDRGFAYVLPRPIRHNKIRQLLHLFFQFHYFLKCNFIIRIGLHQAGSDLFIRSFSF